MMLGKSIRQSPPEPASQMIDEPTQFGSTEYGEVIEEAYDEALLKSFDILERDDFYGSSTSR